VEFELTIPALERAKTVHALDRAATVIGLGEDKILLNLNVFKKRCPRPVFGVLSLAVLLSVGLQDT
jgi:hypothetical protein